MGKMNNKARGGRGGGGKQSGTLGVKIDPNLPFVPEDELLDPDACDHLIVRMICDNFSKIGMEHPMLKQKLKELFKDIGVALPQIRVADGAVIFLLMKSKEDKQKLLQSKALRLMGQAVRFFDIRLDHEYPDIWRLDDPQMVQKALTQRYPLIHRKEQALKVKSGILEKIVNTCAFSVLNEKRIACYESPFFDSSAAGLNGHVLDDLIISFDQDPDTGKIVAGQKLRFGYKRNKIRKFVFLPLDQCIWIPPQVLRIVSSFVSHLQDCAGKPGKIDVYNHKKDAGLICGLKFDAASTGDVIMTIMMTFPANGDFVGIDDIAINETSTLKSVLEAGGDADGKKDPDETSIGCPIGNWSLFDLEQSSQDLRFFNYEAACKQIETFKKSSEKEIEKIMKETGELVAVFLTWYHASRRCRDNGWNRRTNIFWQVCRKKKLLEPIDQQVSLEKLPNAVKVYPKLPCLKQLLSSVIEMANLTSKSTVALCCDYPEIERLVVQKCGHTVLLESLEGCSGKTMKYLQAKCPPEKVSFTPLNLVAIDEACGKPGFSVQSLIIWPNLKSNWITDFICMGIERLIYVADRVKCEDTEVGARSTFTIQTGRLVRTCYPAMVLTRTKIVDCDPLGVEVSVILMFERAPANLPEAENPPVGLPLSFVSNKVSEIVPAKKKKKIQQFREPSPDFSPQNQRGGSSVRERGGKRPWAAVTAHDEDYHDPRMDHPPLRDEGPRRDYGPMDYEDDYGSHGGYGPPSRDYGPRGKYGSPSRDYGPRRECGPPPRDDPRGEYGLPPRDNGPREEYGHPPRGDPREEYGHPPRDYASRGERGPSLRDDLQRNPGPRGRDYDPLGYPPSREDDPRRDYGPPRDGPPSRREYDTPPRGEYGPPSRDGPRGEYGPSPRDDPRGEYGPSPRDDPRGEYGLPPRDGPRGEYGPPPRDDPLGEYGPPPRDYGARGERGPAPRDCDPRRDYSPRSRDYDPRGYPPPKEPAPREDEKLPDSRLLLETIKELKEQQNQLKEMLASVARPALRQPQLSAVAGPSSATDLTPAYLGAPSPGPPPPPVISQTKPPSPSPANRRSYEVSYEERLASWREAYYKNISQQPGTQGNVAQADSKVNAMEWWNKRGGNSADYSQEGSGGSDLDNRQFDMYGMTEADYYGVTQGVGGPNYNGSRSAAEGSESYHGKTAGGGITNNPDSRSAAQAAAQYYGATNYPDSRSAAQGPESYYGKIAGGGITNNPDSRSAAQAAAQYYGTTNYPDSRSAALGPGTNQGNAAGVSASLYPDNRSAAQGPSGSYGKTVGGGATSYTDSRSAAQAAAEYYGIAAGGSTAKYPDSRSVGPSPEGYYGVGAGGGAANPSGSISAAQGPGAIRGKAAGESAAVYPDGRTAAEAFANYYGLTGYPNDPSDYYGMASEDILASQYYAGYGPEYGYPPGPSAASIKDGRSSSQGSKQSLSASGKLPSGPQAYPGNYLTQGNYPTQGAGKNPNQNPSAQHLKRKPSAQHLNQNPSSQHSNQKPSTQHLSQKPSAQHPNQKPSTQRQTQKPSAQSPMNTSASAPSKPPNDSSGRGKFSKGSSGPLSGLAETLKALSDSSGVQ